jgi:hypothetical protein
MDFTRSLEQRVQSAGLRIRELSSLRTAVALPPKHDITEHQWSTLQLQLNAVEARLQGRLKRAADQYLGSAARLQPARSLNAVLGEIEMELSRAFTFFDTYMDVLTQRHTPELGRLLAGCDVLAWGAIRRNHAALRIVAPPLVCCNRGYGAMIIRESVPLPDGSPNPIPLIQIPYSRLKEKCNLTSILHEAGHQALSRLGLVTAIPDAFRAALARAGASEQMKDLWALWSSEIGPDFWTFCASGIAAAGGIREILALPPNQVLRISWTDPHPPPYLRVLLTFEWCRQQWGRGVWDQWEKQWVALYPLGRATAEAKQVLTQGLLHLPVLTRALLTTRFRTLNGQRVPDLFDLRSLSPAALAPVAAGAAKGVLRLGGLAPAAQLAVFRLIKESGRFSEEALDAVMTRWLIGLAIRRPSLHRPRAQRTPGDDYGTRKL